MQFNGKFAIHTNWSKGSAGSRGIEGSQLVGWTTTRFGAHAPKADRELTKETRFVALAPTRMMTTRFGAHAPKADHELTTARRFVALAPTRVRSGRTPRRLIMS